MDRKYLIILITVFLIASAIRLYNPTFRSIWGDEAHSIYRAMEYSQLGYQKTTAGILQDSHFPAYFCALSVWIKCFGVGEYSMRILSVIIGILSVIFFYFFSKGLFEERSALISTFLLSLSPLAIMHSQELRMYGLMMLLTMISSHYFWKLLSGKKGSLNIIGYIIGTILLMLTHIYAILVIAAQFIMILIDYWKERQLSRSLQIFLAQVFVAAVVSPFYLKVLKAGLILAVAGTGEMAFSVFPAFTKPFLFFFVLTLGETVAPWNVPIVLPAIAVYGYLFLWGIRSLQDKRIMFLLIMCLFPVIFSALFLRPTMPKYLITALPFYLLLIGHSLATLEKRYLRYGLILAITILQLCSVYNYFNLKEYHNSNQIEPWRKVSNIIKADHHKGDIIITSYRYIVYQILNYYLNITGGGDYAIFSVEDQEYRVVPVRDSILIFGKGDEIKNAASLTNKRIWLVTHIIDDRALPAGSIERLTRQIKTRYRLLSDERFVPYEETLVSKLPIKRHKEGSARIEVRLYEQ